MKKLICCATLILGLAGLMISGMQVAQAQSAGNLPKVKELRIERSMPPQAVACLECHKQEHPGIFSDWANSRHANANVTCYDCHMAEEHDGDVSPQHYKQYERSDVK
jgi:formate-dependent nitrite reductase cytochrome c552 subunit